MHGFSLNCDNSLDAYASIVACGIRDAGVTTMSTLTGTQITVNDVVPVVTQLFIKEYEDTHAAAV
jgi:lipoyl(octanoyl) transferase